MEMIQVKKVSGGMEKLMEKTCLKEKVSVYIPSTFDVNQKIDNSFYVNHVLTAFSLLFGGASSYEAKGAWVSDEKGLVIEDVTIVYSFTSEINDDVIEKVLDICEWIKEEMKQECVSLEVNNKLYFI